MEINLEDKRIRDNDDEEENKDLQDIGKNDSFECEQLVEEDSKILNNEVREVDEDQWEII
jgi:hypothetical protein